jgi:hypothetical protein
LKGITYGGGMKQIIGDYESFISNIGVGLAESGIDRSELAMMDHICYRVATPDRYSALLQELSAAAILLGETVISGRNIATFELRDYLKVDGWTIPYLELPAPKEGSPYREGLEHAELVVIGALGRFAQRHSDLAFDTKGLTKDINPELGFKTDRLSVKFHEQPLGAVVRIEHSLGRTTAPRS